MTIEKSYSERYKQKDSPLHIYPVEFVVRVFLGTSYPGLKMDPRAYPGRRILDLGFGDGRNFPLLKNLGFKISGAEISDDIIKIAKDKFGALGASLDLRCGRNSSLPYDDGCFDFILGCHSIYYVDCDQNFEANLAEISRVLAPGGTLVASLPKLSNFILREAAALGGGHFKITKDPLGLRNGAVFRAFSSKEEIIETFKSRFTTLAIGSCDDDFFGLRQDIWIAVFSKPCPK